MSDLYTIKQISDLLGLSTNTVYKYVNSGVIRASRPQNTKGRFRVTRKALEEFLGQSIEESTVVESSEVEVTLLSQESNTSTDQSLNTTNSSSIDPTSQKSAIAEASPDIVASLVRPFDSEPLQKSTTEDHTSSSTTQTATPPPAFEPPPSLALRTTRFLLLVALLGIVINVAFFKLPDPMTLLSQLSVLFVFLLLAYQYGGIGRKRSA